MSGRRPRRIALDVRGMMDREDVWRFARTSRRDPAVEAWFAEGPAALRSIAQQWFARMRECGDDVRELMHDGCPVACVGDVPFAYVNTFQSHLNVGFFNGAGLDDPAGLLEGSGKRMRHVKLMPDGELNAAALGNLIDAAYAELARHRG